MKPVEQAIFTSIETDVASGYRLAAQSEGLCEADARELHVWAPASDALLDTSPEAESLNFPPLPSGTYGLTRTVQAGWEQGGGRRMFTHCLVVPAEVLARFANNPLAISQSISQRGLWRNPLQPAAPLKPLSISGGAAPVDQSLLQLLVEQVGSKAMALLVQAARDAVCLAISAACPIERLLAGLFSCLPPQCRLEFSFSTGLKFSPRRPYRLLMLASDPAERAWTANYPNVTTLELGPEMPKSMLLDGWSLLVERALAADRIAFLAAQLSKRRFDLGLDDLPALGLQLLESLDGSQLRGEAPTDRQPRANPLAHAAHRQFAKSAESASATLSAQTAPSAEIGLQSPEILEKLEYLDDLVYEAISGHAGSLEQLRTAWPKLLAELGEPMLSESREQYLRYALSVWQECSESDGIRNPSKAIQALDVLCLLFGESV